MTLDEALDQVRTLQAERTGLRNSIGKLREQLAHANKRLAHYRARDFQNKTGQALKNRLEAPNARPEASE